MADNFANLPSSKYHFFLFSTCWVKRLVTDIATLLKSPNPIRISGFWKVTLSLVKFFQYILPAWCLHPESLTCVRNLGMPARYICILHTSCTSTLYRLLLGWVGATHCTGWFIGSVCIVLGRDKGQLFSQTGFLKPANWPLLQPLSEWFHSEKAKHF